MKGCLSLSMLVLFLLLILPACCDISPSIGQDRAVISGQVILDQISKGQPVIYDGIEIDGSVLFFPNDPYSSYQDVNSSICITNSIFQGKVMFAGAHFMKPVTFDGSSFASGADFTGSIFENKSSFAGCQFIGPVGFMESSFYMDADYSQCKFLEESSFARSVFFNVAHFDNAAFSDASFKDCVFEGQATFGEAKFERYATFENSTFTGGAGFNKANFMGKVDICSSRFEKKVYLFDAAFFDTASFSDTSFRHVFFNNVRFAGDVLFLNTSFLGPVRFLDTRFEKEANFYRAIFQSEIILDGSSFSQLVLHWSAIKSHLVLNDNAKIIFNKLIENYKALGWLADANQCYFDLRRWTQERKDWTTISKIPDIFLENYIGYGTQPLRALYWILPIILIFGIKYWHGGGIYRHNKPDISQDKLILKALKTSPETYQIEFVQSSPKRDSSQFISLARSIYFSFIIFTSRNAGNMQASDGLSGWVAWEKRIGLTLFTIFSYYVGKYVISYFMPGI